MLQKTKVIILNSIKYAEADLIVHAYTQEFGLKSYYVRSVLSKKKGKINKAFFQPLSQLEIIGKHNLKGQLNQLQEISVSYHYQTVQTDIVKQSIALFLSEILSHSLQEDSQEDGFYNFLEQALQWLDLHEKVGNFHLAFIGQLIRYLGVYPILEPVQPYFDMVEGKYVSSPISNVFLSGEACRDFDHIMKNSFEEVLKTTLDKEKRKMLLAYQLDYLSLHLPHFKKPKSLDIFIELFL